MTDKYIGAFVYCPEIPIKVEPVVADYISEYTEITKRTIYELDHMDSQPTYEKIIN